MISLFSTPITSSILIILTILYTLAASIVVLDIRIQQAKKDGIFPEDEDHLPGWIIFIYWIYWIVFFFIILLNWKYAIVIFVMKFILKVFPVLEILGNILMSPFKNRKE